MNKRLYILLLIFLSGFSLFSQDINNKRSYTLEVKLDTILLDSLSIVPSSLKLSDTSNNVIDTSLYEVLFIESKLIWKGEKNTVINIEYQTFPIDFSKTYYNKDIKNLEPDDMGLYNPFRIEYDYKASEDVFDMGDLSKNGNISRGVSFGNNQDVVLNSSLDLQLSGKLSEKFNILAALTDDNIPIQPDGNTQQIQEFDKVFIQLYNEKTSIIAGDFEIQDPDGYFMKFYKKAQGGSFSTKVDLLDSEKKDMGKLTVSGAAAISKGKYNRQTINVIEGNQGPYKLSGADNERYIIVLSGTEKVYIDGKLMARGQGFDYVIDYNTAEVTFTPNQLITKDKRVIVEFEYSDKNYARSLFYVGTDYQNDKFGIQFNVFSEQDSKNQSLQQDLSLDDKRLLSSIGDSINNALVSNVDSVEFTNDAVLYKMVDTLGYDSVYVYSTNPDSAYYRLGFSFVGEGNGDYEPISSSANGKVYKWIEPIAGVRQGSYLPVVLLVTPKKTRMYTLATDYKFSEKSKLSMELAISDYDINTFSKKNSNDNYGFGVKTMYSKKNKIGSKNWEIHTDVNYEFVDKYFKPLETYRDVEFNRDWNLSSTNKVNEHISEVNLALLNQKTFNASYNVKSFNKGNVYNGLRNYFSTELDKNGFKMLVNGSYLLSEDELNTSNFLRYNASLSKSFKYFVIGVRDESENNIFRVLSNDSLQNSSYNYNTWEAYISSPDTSINKYSVFYKQRTDKLPLNNILTKAMIADDIGLNLDILKNPKSQFKGNITYRNLAIVDTNLTTEKADNSVISQFEYRFKAFKGVVTSNTFYEIGSGMEVRKDYTYIEVPTGQGTYIWNDNNGNGITELDEFEVAAFQNEANYIRLFTPTSDYIRTFNNSFSEVINLRPKAKSNKGLKKFISRFHNTTSYRIDRKTSEDDILKNTNPFEQSINDSNIMSLNSAFRNTIFFNQSSQVFGCDYSYQDIRNRILLSNGIDTRSNKFHDASARWNISKKYTFTVEYVIGEKNSNSEYFNTRDYEIDYQEIKPKFSYQSGSSFRVSFLYNLVDKKNTIGNLESSKSNDVGTEITYSKVQKGSLVFKMNYIQIEYSGQQNSSVSYELLSGLQPGDNATWSFSYQRNLSKNMQLSVLYDGRKSEENKAIHTGGVQVRAYF